MSNIQTIGSCRVNADNVGGSTFLANSGAFLQVTNNGVGDNSIFMDSDVGLAGVNDTFQVGIEETGDAVVAVERVAPGQIRVRTTDIAAGAPVDVNFSVDWRRAILA